MAPNQATFSFIDTSVEGGEDLLPLWQSKSPPPSAASLSFSATDAAPVEQIPTWRISLPNDEKAAHQSYDLAKNQMDGTQSAMDKAPELIEQMLAAQQQQEMAAVSFSAIDAPPPPQLDPAQQSAFNLMQQLDQHQSGASMVSFSTESTDEMPKDWQDAKQQLEKFMKQAARSLTQMAWVETEMEAQLMGRTAVSWGGNFNTIWQTQVSTTQMELHYRSLGLALLSRTTILRTISLIGSTATKLVALSSSGIGVVRSLPVAWKFIKEIQSEWQRYQDEKTFINQQT